MSKIEKLIARFRSMPRDFTWDELTRLLRYFGYVEIHGSGSRRKFVHVYHPLIILHEPHPIKYLKAYQMAQVYNVLIKERLL